MSIDLSLHRIQALLSCLPLYTRPTIHIAGTNGKGSVSAFLTFVLCSTEPPARVGRFNSPHLVSILDSITIDNVAVSQSLYDAARAEVEVKDKAGEIGASSFELLTATAMLLFERQEVDVVVCEVGMGGRLDATNAIPDEAIILSVITAIDLDHQAFLGNTVEAIAREKAGIIRRQKAVVIGPQPHPGVAPVINGIASALENDVILAKPVTRRSWDISDGPIPSPFSINPFTPPPPTPVYFNIPGLDRRLKLLLGLHGEHQLYNVGISLTALFALRVEKVDMEDGVLLRVKDKNYSLPFASLRKAIHCTTWPGRLSFHNYTIPGEESENKHLTLLVDGAHNSASSERLAAYISDLLSSLSESDNEKKTLTLTYILALSHSPPKTVEDVIFPLLSPHTRSVDHARIRVRVAALSFSPPEGMPWVKAVPPSQIREAAENVLPSAVFWPAISEPSQNLAKALEWAATSDLDSGDSYCLTVVAGSLYLVADLYRLLNSNAQE